MLVSPDHHDHPSSASDQGGVQSPRSRPQELEIDSLRLLQGQRELRIRHGNECYRLRHTRNDKLILTK